MNKIQERITVVCGRIVETSIADEAMAEVYATGLQAMLTSLEDNDFFGTEGQCDPRGDQRDEEWSMDNVQGLDD